MAAEPAERDRRGFRRRHAGGRRRFGRWFRQALRDLCRGGENRGRRRRGHPAGPRDRQPLDAGRSRVGPAALHASAGAGRRAVHSGLAIRSVPAAALLANGLLRHGQSGRRRSERLVLREAGRRRFRAGPRGRSGCGQRRRRAVRHQVSARRRHDHRRHPERRHAHAERDRGPVACRLRPAGDGSLDRSGRAAGDEGDGGGQPARSRGERQSGRVRPGSGATRLSGPAGHRGHLRLVLAQRGWTVDLQAGQRQAGHRRAGGGRDGHGELPRGERRRRSHHGGHHGAGRGRNRAAGHGRCDHRRQRRSGRGDGGRSGRRRGDRTADPGRPGRRRAEFRAADAGGGRLRGRQARPAGDRLAHQAADRGHLRDFRAGRERRVDLHARQRGSGHRCARRRPDRGRTVPGLQRRRHPGGGAHRGDGRRRRGDRRRRCRGCGDRRRSAGRDGDGVADRVGPGCRGTGIPGAHGHRGHLRDVRPRCRRQVVLHPGQEQGGDRRAARGLDGDGRLRGADRRRHPHRGDRHRDRSGRSGGRAGRERDRGRHGGRRGDGGRPGRGPGVGKADRVGPGHEPGLAVPGAGGHGGHLRNVLPRERRGVGLHARQLGCRHRRAARGPDGDGRLRGRHRRRHPRRGDRHGDRGERPGDRRRHRLRGPGAGGDAGRGRRGHVYPGARPGRQRFGDRRGRARRHRPADHPHRLRSRHRHRRRGFVRRAARGRRPPAPSGDRRGYRHGARQTGRGNPGDRVRHVAPAGAGRRLRAGQPERRRRARVPLAVLRRRRARAGRGGQAQAGRSEPRQRVAADRRGRRQRGRVRLPELRCARRRRGQRPPDRDRGRHRLAHHRRRRGGK